MVANGVNHRLSMWKRHQKSEEILTLIFPHHTEIVGACNNGDRRRPAETLRSPVHRMVNEGTDHLWRRRRIVTAVCGLGSEQHTPRAIIPLVSMYGHGRLLCMVLLRPEEYGRSELSRKPESQMEAGGRQTEQGRPSSKQFKGVDESHLLN